jgi:hypothetical protein
MVVEGDCLNPKGGLGRKSKVGDFPRIGIKKEKSLGHKSKKSGERHLLLDG